jgi:hypothetical protein
MAYWLVYALLGPPIGFLVFVAGGVILNGSAALEMVPLSVMIGLPLSYVLGLVPALIAAFAVQLGQRGSSVFERIWILCVGLGTGIPFSTFMEAALLEPVLSDIDLSPIGGGSVVYVLVCLIPTFACWYLSKYLNRSAGTLGVPPAQPQKVRG